MTYRESKAKEQQLINESKIPQVEREMIRDVTRIIIPQCCREGWDSCKHVVHAELPRKIRNNVGL